MAVAGGTPGVFGLRLGQRLGSAVEIQQLGQSHTASDGELLQGGQAYVAPTAGFDMLVVFVTETGFFGKGLLAESARFPESLNPRQ